MRSSFISASDHSSYTNPFISSSSSSSSFSTWASNTLPWNRTSGSCAPATLEYLRKPSSTRGRISSPAPCVFSGSRSNPAKRRISMRHWSKQKHSSPLLTHVKALLARPIGPLVEPAVVRKSGPVVIREPPEASLAAVVAPFLPEPPTPPPCRAPF